MPTNSAAWLTAPYAPFVVEDAPYTRPQPTQIVIRNRAIAVNPLDDIKQSSGNLMYGWLPARTVLGEDVAGEVAEIGSAVTRFAVGDRVTAYAVGMEKGRRHAAEGGFQLYTVVESSLAAPIPEGMRFENAAVLPLGISTAASALFQKDLLGLRHPGSAGRADATVVIWGGSTSVGMNAIQLAAAAGYDVVATASTHNHQRLRELGATAVFEYAQLPELISSLQGRKVAGVVALGTGSAAKAITIAAATGARRVAMASPSVSLAGLPQRSGFSLPLVRALATLVATQTALQVRAARHRIRARFVWGSALMNNEVGPMLWEQFLPAALAEGRYIAAPTAQVVGSGLDQVQTALDALHAGVSARKLVVTL